MKGKFSIVIDNGMSRIGSSLESHDNVRFLGKHIGDLSLSLITPVSSNDCFDHNTFFLLVFSLVRPAYPQFSDVDFRFDPQQFLVGIQDRLYHFPDKGFSLLLGASHIP